MDDDENVNPSIFIIDRKCDSSKAMRVTSFDKWIIASIIAVVFFIFSLPFVYKLTNTATRCVKLNAASKNGSPTVLGIIIHAIIFMIVVRLLMH